MGQSTTIAAAFAALIILIGIIAIVTTNFSSLEAVSGTIEKQVSQSEAIMREGSRIDSYKIINPQRIRFNITNTGEISVRAEDFKFLDLFIVYNVSGKDTSSRINYDQTNSSIDSWLIRAIYFNNKLKNVANPLNLNQSTYRSWDPLETIEIECKFSFPITRFQDVVFIMPNGSRSTMGSVIDENGGEAVLPLGDSNVVVKHDIGIKPSNIQITPASPTPLYWISDVNNMTFTIHINGTALNDIYYYWWAKK
jgi:hypothetical protein